MTRRASVGPVADAASSAGLQAEWVRRGVGTVHVTDVDSFSGKPEWPRVWNRGPAEPKGAPAFLVLVAFEVRTTNEANGSTRRTSARDATTLALSLTLVEHPLRAGPGACA
jgi:hypothetical protein